MWGNLQSLQVRQIYLVDLCRPDAGFEQFVGTDLDREDLRHFAAGPPVTESPPCPVVSVGSVNGSIIHPCEVFKAAIPGNAAALILFHNHISAAPRGAQVECYR